MREFELVRHPQINGLQLFIDTVQYRTPHFHQELELIWLADGALNVRIEQTQLKVGPGEMVPRGGQRLHFYVSATFAREDRNSCPRVCATAFSKALPKQGVGRRRL